MLMRTTISTDVKKGVLKQKNVLKYLYVQSDKKWNKLYRAVYKIFNVRVAICRFVCLIVQYTVSYKTGYIYRKIV